MSQLSPQQLKQLESIENALSVLMARVFQTPDGMQLLDLMDDVFLRQPVCAPGMKEGEGYYREGRNSLVRQFRAAVNRAKHTSATEANDLPEPIV